MPKIVQITVDDRRIEAEAGTSLLTACLDHGIYIPHICYLPGGDPAAACCRLCLVEIKDEQRPVASCAVRIDRPLTVRTDTAGLRRLQKSALQLLLSVHRVDCKNCPANRKCALQEIARFLKVGLKPGRLPPRLKEPEVDDRHPCLQHYPNRCVLCGKCIQVCRVNKGQPALTFAGRGFQTVIRYFGSADSHPTACNSCQSCVDVCPVGALEMKKA